MGIFVLILIGIVFLFIHFIGPLLGILISEIEIKALDRRLKKIQNDPNATEYCIYSSHTGSFTPIYIYDLDKWAALFTEEELEEIRKKTSQKNFKEEETKKEIKEKFVWEHHVDGKKEWWIRKLIKDNDH